MFKAIDLFAGVGGLSLGLKMANIEPLIGIENDKSCIEALNYNFPSKIIIGKDIRNISKNEMLDYLGSIEVDVLAGGPPCQGFSLIGLRDPNDERSRLVFEFIRFAKELQPKFIVMENVPGMLSAQGGEFIKELINVFDEVGYNIRLPIKVLNAADYGVPQNRKRVFILGSRKDIKILPEYPLPTYMNIRENKVDIFLGNLPKTPTVLEAIGDLPNIDNYDHLVEDDEVLYEIEPVSEYAKIMRGYIDSHFSILDKNNWNSKICSGCRRTVHGEVLTNRFKNTKQGDTAPVSRLYKLIEHDVANTLRAGTPRERGAYSAPRPIHPHFPRVVSVREGARLQSFPDWHRFHKTKWHGFRQVGNAVPPLLAMAVSKEIYKCLIQLNSNK